MLVQATQEKIGTVYGTLTKLELPDDTIVFSLLLDDAPAGARKQTSPDNWWATITEPTLSDVLEEATRLGLSDIRPC